MSAITAKTARTAVVLAFLAGGCARASLPPLPPPTLTHAEGAGGCPLGVAGASVVAEDTPDGIALSFRSTANAAEMRERAHDAAAQHGTGQHLGRGHHGEHGEWGDHGLQLTQMPAVRAVSEDIEGGARIRFVAVNPPDTDVLRRRLRDRANAMADLTCKRSPPSRD